MKNVPINIGIIGVGHLGQHHVKHYKRLQDVNVVGIYDRDKGRGSEIANQYDTSVYNNVNDLINNVEAVSIVTPTSSHGKIAELCIKKNKHVFLFLWPMDTNDSYFGNLLYATGGEGSCACYPGNYGIPGAGDCNGDSNGEEGTGTGGIITNPISRSVWNFGGPSSNGHIYIYY